MFYGLTELHSLGVLFMLFSTAVIMGIFFGFTHKVLKRFYQTKGRTKNQLEI